jgi:hypothetical protein
MDQNLNLARGHINHKVKLQQHFPENQIIRKKLRNETKIALFSVFDISAIYPNHKFPKISNFQQKETLSFFRLQSFIK